MPKIMTLRQLTSELNFTTMHISSRCYICHLHDNRDFRNNFKNTFPWQRFQSQKTQLSRGLYRDTLAGPFQFISAYELIRFLQTFSQECIRGISTPSLLLSSSLRCFKISTLGDKARAGGAGTCCDANLIGRTRHQQPQWRSTNSRLRSLLCWAMRIRRHMN